MDGSMQSIYSDCEQANQYDWRTMSVCIDESDSEMLGEARSVCVSQLSVSVTAGV
jgi:hypothetical protein